MGDTNIEYDEAFGIGNFQREIVEQLGARAWEAISDDGAAPAMADLIERLGQIADAPTVHRILINVRHGLKPSQSAWAREALARAGDLDTFIENQVEQGLRDFENLLREGKDFYGQPVTEEVLAFIRENPGMLSGVREGNILCLTAFPAEMEKYLRADDPVMRRYYACHCPFAKESILEGKTVSATLCHCSLGHVMNFWEAAFDTELTGEVLASALAGDEKCAFSVRIPDHIMERFVHTQ